jgi:hypothetical protein
MYSGIAEIPTGWAICDGGSYTYMGITTTTPNLTGRFIKAVTNINEIGEVNNTNLNTNEDGTLTNTLTLAKENLPEHNHPHNEHTHEFDGTIDDGLSQSALTYLSYNSNEYNAIYKDDEILNAVTSITKTSTNLSHTHTITGTITPSTREEKDDLQWTNEPINIEPNYYALIFIMKL